MNNLVIQKWKEEGIVYNIQSGDMHLISAWGIELIVLLSNNEQRAVLVSKVSQYFKMDTDEAEKYLDKLCLEYQKFNLIN